MPVDDRGEGVATDLDLPVKTEFKSAGGSMVVQYTNIKRGPQPASLFEIHKGYKKATPPRMAAPPKGAPNPPKRK